MYTARDSLVRAFHYQATWTMPNWVPLPLVELGVLKGGEALDLVQERRGDAVLRDEQTLGEHR